MDPAIIVEDTERTRFCPQTDRRANGQGERSIPPSTSLSGGFNNGRLWLITNNTSARSSMETITGKLKKSEQIVSWRIYPPVPVHFSSIILKYINQGTMNDPYSFKPHNPSVSNQISNQWSSAQINIKMATW